MSEELPSVCPILISLNPYYNGKYSMRELKCNLTDLEDRSLNPYYNGKYSMSISKNDKEIVPRMS